MNITTIKYYIRQIIDKYEELSLHTVLKDNIVFGWYFDLIKNTKCYPDNATHALNNIVLVIHDRFLKDNKLKLSILRQITNLMKQANSEFMN